MQKHFRVKKGFMGRKRSKSEKAEFKKRKADSSDEEEEEQQARRSEQRKKAKAASAIPTSTSISVHHLPAAEFSSEPICKQLWTGPMGEDPPSERLKAIRKQLGILVKGALELCPDPVQLGDPFLPPQFSAVFSNLGLRQPTPVQMQTWPAVLSGANTLW